jgi:mannitol-1-/sugar-/sorbitol-6-/2-deoxyglucose-6-phosphatase
MQGKTEAVIFDMDGVLINSEHLWRKAMIEGFAAYGMPVSEDDCRKTMGMRFGEVVRLWLKHFEITAIPAEVEKSVINILLRYIRTEGEVIRHIPELIALCHDKGLRLGLATSSSTQLMDAILGQLGLENSFHAKVSAEHLRYGKPHPEVFLKCASLLEVEPQCCLVIEDSLNGVIAGKAAQMKVIAVPDDEHTRMQQFAVADYKMNDMGEVLSFFKELFMQPVAGESSTESETIKNTQ